MVCTLDAKRMVFVDECGAHTSLAPLYAWAPPGERAYSKVPHRLALLRVLFFAEGAPCASYFLLRADGVNRYPQAPAYGCPVPHPNLLRLVFSTSLYLIVHEVGDK